MRRLVGALAALTLLLAGAAACSDDEGTEDATGGQGPADATGPELGEHWHVAYAIQVCGEVLPPSADRGADALGIHTHADGLIHVHPFLAAAAGRDATLKAFLDQIGARIDGDGFALADGATELPTCADDAVVRIGQWDRATEAAGGAEPDRIVTQDLDQVVLAPDLSALTIAVGPADDAIEPPAAAADICRLAAVDGPIQESEAEPEGGGEAEEPPCADEQPSAEDLEDQFTEEAPLESVAGQPCAGEAIDPGFGAPEVVVPAGPPPTETVIEDLSVGDGTVAAEGDAVTVDYVGVACSSGEVFDSSYEAGQPATFDLVPGSLIEGFATGVEGMAVGGRRLVVIPSEQAYGSDGSPPAIAPDEALVFVIELVAVG